MDFIINNGAETSLKMYLSFYAFSDSQDSFQTFMPNSSHIQSVLIGVKYRNCRQTLDAYLHFAISIGQIQSKLIYIFVTYGLASL